MSEVSEAVRASIARCGIEGRVLAAVSGGADSTALLFALIERGISITVAHVNHGLRMNADGDEDFVRALCEKLGVPFLTRRISVSQGEDAARRGRYAALREMKKEAGAEVIALAHHAGDQAETLLMHLCRGGGTRGLSGMKERSQDLWRPLLSVSRGELREYLREKGQSWREDESNQSARYARNLLRLRALPEIERAYPGAESALCRAADILGGEDDFLSLMTEEWLRKSARRDECYSFLLTEPFNVLHPALKRRAMRALCGEMTLAQTDRACALAQEAPGKSVNLPGGKRLYRSWTRLCVTPCGREALSQITRAPFTGGDRGDGLRSQAFPEEALDGAEVRYRRPGDIITPFGSKGAQSLKQYMIDRKIDQPFRDGWPLLARGSEILWVIGRGASERARVYDRGVLCTYTGRLPEDTEEGT